MGNENDWAIARSFVGALRIFALLIALTPILVSSVAAAKSSPGKANAPGLTHFLGQIKGLTGPAANPTGFALQLDSRTINLRINTTVTVFTAHSAEAWVDGFAVGDFASVWARRVNRAWVAQRIVFDVRPFGQLKTITLTGTILRVSKDGSRAQLQPTVGDARWILIRPTTRFRVNGVATTIPPVLTKGDVVQVVLRRTVQGWITVEVNIKSTPIGSPV